jgi:hypothetical protein
MLPVLLKKIPRRTTFKFEYLREYEPEFENVLGYELGAHMGSIREKKTRGQKSRATVPLSCCRRNYQENLSVPIP